jgi:BirA family transcriptional regulator, biotin operon repressor / biotin---[acetyl-CoA-carboxylase] ligase
MTVDAKILMALRQAAGGAVSGADLSNELGISRAAVWARIEELRSLGYEIEASPHRGYRLLQVPDVLHADDLLSLVPGNRVIGRDIRVFQETASTNEVVDRLARAGVKEGVVVFAETQTKGRGRLGRNWVSPAGKGLWFSVLLRPRLRPQAATQLTVAAATALARALEQHAGLRAQIKWPNDILAGGKKLAGVLTELSAELDCINYVVLGIGLNVNLNATDLGDLRKQATSLKLETGRTFRRADLAAALLRELDRDYALVCGHQFTKISEQWEAKCSTLGHRVSIRMGDRTVVGLAEALDEDGALLVRKQHGHLERIIGGDVTLEQP